MESKSRGRPVKSEIRQNIIDILYHSGPLYGYRIYRIYIDIFPGITMRSVYYHLSKGVKTEELKVKEVKREKGDYSWGTEVEKIYYTLGEKANPRENSRIKEYLKKK